MTSTKAQLLHCIGLLQPPDTAVQLGYIESVAYVVSNTSCTALSHFWVGAQLDSPCFVGEVHWLTHGEYSAKQHISTCWNHPPMHSNRRTSGSKCSKSQLIIGRRPDSAGCYHSTSAGQFLTLLAPSVCICLAACICICTRILC